ncbi:MAG: EVE domain-containing protein [Phycisphaerae bacterium]
MEHFATPVTLERIKATKELNDMVLVQRSRLSIQPVTKPQWQLLLAMGRGKA